MALTTSSAPRRSSSLPIILGVWFVAALATGVSGVLGRLPFPAPAMVPVLTLACLAAVAFSPGLRDAVMRRGPAPLVALHLVRFVGIYFLYLNSRGRLPGEFAIAAGWGDIAVAVGAIAVLAWVLPARTAGRRRALLAWNIFGLVDIGMVIATAMRLAITRPDNLMEFARLPMALLPTFFVPLIIASHILIFIWLARGAPDRPG